MPQFYDVHPFVVQPEKESSGMQNYWNILNPGGVKLAVMHHRADSLPQRVFRGMGMKANFGAHIAIDGLDGQPLMTFRKGFSLGLFRAKAFDSQKRLLGFIREKKQGLEGRQYLLADPSGNYRGCLEGDWRSYSLQMRDARGSVIGKISRKAEDLNKVIFTEKAAYYVVRLYIPQPNEPFRMLLLGTSAAMALLLR